MRWRRQVAMPSLFLLAISSSFTGQLLASTEADYPVAGLARITVLESPHSGFVEVSISRDVELKLGSASRSRGNAPRSVDIDGGGRLTTVVLRPENASADDSQNLIIGRFRTCKRQGCRTGKEMYFSYTGTTSSRRVALEAGRYQLYFFADGEDARVTLRIPQLDGVSRIDEFREIPNDFKTPGHASASSDDGPILSSGATYEAGDSGMILAFLYFRLASGNDFNYGICHYAGPVAPPRDVAYGPHCSAASFAGLGAGSMVILGDGTAWAEIFMTTYGGNTVPPSIDGTQGLGTWLATSGQISETTTHTLFLPWVGD